MKKKSFLILAVLLISLSGCYHRIGSLTMVSTRNIETNANYVLVQRYVTGVAKTKRNESLQQAVDNAVKQHHNGEFMKNVVILMKNNGKKIKVTGDVWGTR